MASNATGPKQIVSAMREPILAALSSTLLHDAQSSPGINGENFYAQKLLDQIKTASDLNIVGVKPPYIVSIEPSSYTAKATGKVISTGIVLRFDRYDSINKRPCGESRRIVIAADEWMQLMQDRLELIKHYHSLGGFNVCEQERSVASEARTAQGSVMGDLVKSKAAQQGITLGNEAARLLAYSATELLSARMRTDRLASSVLRPNGAGYALGRS